MLAGSQRAQPLVAEAQNCRRFSATGKRTLNVLGLGRRAEVKLVKARVDGPPA